MTFKDAARTLLVSIRFFCLAVLVGYTLRFPQAGGLGSSNIRTENQKPNLIFILADDLGYGDLGCYGQKKIRTPNIDRLAAEGVRFTQCYAGCTVCAPSRSALMTGQHTGHTRIRGNDRFPLKPEDFTVAELLKSAGYRTALFGKWGLGEAGSTGSPLRQGFDEYFGYLNQKHAHNYYPSYLWRNDRKIQLRNEVPNEDGEGAGVATRRADYSHDLLAREALDYLDRKHNHPFFLYLPFTIPHANNEAKAKGMEVLSDAPYSGEPWPEPERNKAAMITRLDADVGRIMHKLKEFGIDQNTIVFFTSDNGPHKEGGNDPKFFNSSGPLRGIKRDMHDGGIRVPMIVRWPGRIKPGAVNDYVWAFWDFLPTAASLAGIKPPKQIDGVSVAPTLFGKWQPSHKFLYWEFHEKGFKQAVRMGDWKAIRAGTNQPMELYNLKLDIGETNNVANEHQGVVKKIEAYLKSARTESEHWPVRSAPEKTQAR